MQSDWCSPREACQDTGGPKQSQTGMRPRVPGQSIQRAQHLQRSIRKIQKVYLKFCDKIWSFHSIYGSGVLILFLLLRSISFNSIYVLPLVQLSRRIEIRCCFCKVRVCKMISKAKVCMDQRREGVDFNARCL